MRGFVAYIRERGWTDDVLQRVPPSACAIIETPPLPTEWVFARDMAAIADAVQHIAGLEAVHEMGHQATQRGLFALMQPVLRGILRVFGRTPAAVFAKADLVMQRSSRGYEFAYEPRSERSGTIRITSEDLREDAASCEIWAGGYEAVYAVCDVTGRVSVVDIAPAGRGSRVELSASWTPRTPTG